MSRLDDPSVHADLPSYTREGVDELWYQIRAYRNSGAYPGALPGRSNDSAQSTKPIPHIYPREGLLNCFQTAAEARLFLEQGTLPNKLTRMFRAGTAERRTLDSLTHELLTERYRHLPPTPLKPLLDHEPLIGLDRLWSTGAIFRPTFSIPIVEQENQAECFRFFVTEMDVPVLTPSFSGERRFVTLSAAPWTEGWNEYFCTEALAWAIDQYKTVEPAVEISIVVHHLPEHLQEALIPTAKITIDGMTKESCIPMIDNVFCPPLLNTVFIDAVDRYYDDQFHQKNINTPQEDRICPGNAYDGPTTKSTQTHVLNALYICGQEMKNPEDREYETTHAEYNHIHHTLRRLSVAAYGFEISIAPDPMPN